MRIRRIRWKPEALIGHIEDDGQITSDANQEGLTSMTTDGYYDGECVTEVKYG